MWIRAMFSSVVLNWLPDLEPCVSHCLLYISASYPPLSSNLACSNPLLLGSLAVEWKGTKGQVKEIWEDWCGEGLGCSVFWAKVSADLIRSSEPRTALRHWPEMGWWAWGLLFHFTQLSDAVTPRKGKWSWVKWLSLDKEIPQGKWAL